MKERKRNEAARLSLGLEDDVTSITTLTDHSAAAFCLDGARVLHSDCYNHNLIS